MENIEIIKSFKTALTAYVAETGIYWYEEKAYAFIKTQIENNNLL